MNLLRTVQRACAQAPDDERAGIENPRRLPWLALLDAIAWIVTGLVAWLCAYHTPQHSFWHATLVVVVTWPVGTYVLLRRRRRARAYQRGWLDGRKLMLASIEEAVRRDMTLMEWVHAEIERDQKVIDHL